MNKFLDVVKIKLDEEIERYFLNVEVESIKKSKKNNTLNFYVVSDHLIPYKYIKYLKKEIATQILDYDGESIENSILEIPIKIFVKYNLSNSYTSKLLFEDIRVEILEELKDTDKILATIFDMAKFEFNDDNNLKITFAKNDVLFDKQKVLCDTIRDLYKYRFNVDINIETAYKELTSDYARPATIKKDENGIQTNVEKNEHTENKEVNKNNNLPPIVIKSNNKRVGISEDGEILYGKKSKSKSQIYSLADLNEEKVDIKIKAILFSYTYKETKNGRLIFTLNVNDGTGSTAVKCWGDAVELQLYKSRFSIGDELEIIGKYIFDQYEHGYILMPNYIEKLAHRKAIDFGSAGDEEYYSVIISDREDDEKEKRVELHLHTKASAKDGIGSVEGYIETALKFGMKAMAITDHGCVNALADAYEYIAKQKTKPDLKIINGVEGYLVEDFENFYYDKDNKESKRSQKLNGKYVIFDFVTTGYKKDKDSIIKIKATLIENLEVKNEFSSFVHYDRPLLYDIIDKTGIMDSDLRDAPLLKDVLAKFIEFSDGAVFVTLNKNFVWNLSDILRENGFNDNVAIIDLMVLSRLMLRKIKIDGATKVTASSQAIAKMLNIKLESVTDKKKEDRRKELTIDERIELANLILIELLKKLLLEDNMDDLLDINKKYVIDNNFISRQKSYHIVLLAKNDVGRVNLYKIVSESHVTYFHKKPKIPRSLLSKYREGIIVGSACIVGEFMNAIKNGESNEVLKSIASFYDYLEIQPVMNNSFLLRENPEIFKDVKDLENLNRKVIEIADALNKPVVATCDCHYIEKSDKVYREILMVGATSKKSDLDENGNIKPEVLAEMETSSDEELYFRTTREMLDEFAYLGPEKAYEVVIKNTNLINNMVEDIIPLRMDKCPPSIEGSEEELITSCHNNLHKIYGENPIPEISDRLEKELKYIIDNGYSVMYIAAKKLIDFSKEHGYPVGSRGSVGSSLAATMSGVSEVNPLPPHYVCPKCFHIEYETEETKKFDNDTGFDMPDKNCPECGAIMKKDGVNIPFETFLGIPGDEKAQKEPDIDLNFCSVYQPKIHDHTVSMFGQENTFKAGTVGTVATKTAFAYVNNFAKRHSMVFSKQHTEYCKNKIVECKNTTGQHPGGMVVVPHGEYIYTFTPVQIAADKAGNDITTHYDYHKIDKNLLKLDLLGHDAPLLLKKLTEYTGEDYNTVPFYKNEIMELFKSTKSLGITPADISGTKLGCLTIPEFGTDFAMGMCEDAKPETIADLIRIAGLAHGTDVWQNNVKDLIQNGDCTLANAICCRDDIMLYLINKGLDKGLSFNIMEKVRKGKGLTPEWVDEMRKHDVPEWYIGCCKKIKYMFPKAHAAAYVLAALRIAYYKVFRPKEYYAAYFSIKKDGFDYKLMLQSREQIHFQIETIRHIINEKSSKDKKFDNAIKLYDRPEDIYEMALAKLNGTNDFDNDNESNEKSEEDINVDLKEKYKSMSAKNISDLLMCYRIVEEMKARGVDFCPINIYNAKSSDFQVFGDMIMPSFDSIPGIGTKDTDNDENIDFENISTAKRCELEGRKGEYTSINDFKNRTRVTKTIILQMKDMGILDGLVDDLDDSTKKEKTSKAKQKNKKMVEESLPLFDLLNTKE